MNAALLAFTLLFIVAPAVASGAWLYKGYRDARERDADLPKYPPFISRELRDIEQRRQWKRLTPAQQQYVRDGLFRTGAGAA